MATEILNGLLVKAPKPTDFRCTVGDTAIWTELMYDDRDAIPQSYIFEGMEVLEITGTLADPIYNKWVLKTKGTDVASRVWTVYDMTGYVKETMDADLDADGNLIINLPKDEETSAADLRHIKMSSYPFDEWVQNGDFEVFKMIRDIRLIGADPTKEYVVWYVRRNVGGTHRVFIKESGGVDVCRFYENHTPPVGSEEIFCDEYGGSGITANLIVDWFALSDRTWTTSAGIKIHPQCYFDKYTQIETNKDNIATIQPRVDITPQILQENFSPAQFNFDWSKTILSAEITPHDSDSLDFLYKDGEIRQFAINYIQEVSAPNDYKISLYLKRDSGAWYSYSLLGTIGIDGTSDNLLVSLLGFTADVGITLDFKIWIDTTTFGVYTITGVSGLYATEGLINKEFVRSMINKYNAELPLDADLQLPFWQRASIYAGIMRIPSFFRRQNPNNTGSPNSMLKRFNIGFGPDMHEDWGGSGSLDRLKYFANLIKEDTNANPVFGRQMLQAFICQGDLIFDHSPTLTRAESIANLDELAAYIPDFGIDLLLGAGNHDWNSAFPSETTISKDQNIRSTDFYTAITANLVSELSIVVDAANPNSNYYYKDYIDFQSAGVYEGYKVRVIILDQYDGVPETDDGTYLDYPRQFNSAYSQEQMDWLADFALNLPSSDYHVIICTHEGPTSTHQANTSNLAVQEIIDAFVMNGTYSRSDTTTDFTFNVSGDFSSINGFSGVFAAMIYGHGHIPNLGVFTVSGRDYNRIEVPALQSSQSSIGFSRFAPSGGADMVDFLSLDVIDRKLYFLRYGNPCDVDGVGLPFGDRLGIDY